MYKIILENTVCGNASDGVIMLAAEKIIKEAFGGDTELMIFDHDAETSQDIYLEQYFRPTIAGRLYTVNPKPGTFSRWAAWYKNLKSDIALWAAKQNKWRLVTFLLGYDLSDDVKHYVEADMIITNGGSYLMEYYNLQERLKQFEIDTYFGKPPVLFTQSLGPFTKLENREKIKSVLDATPLVLLRDRQSQIYLQDLLEQPQKSFILADSAFALMDHTLVDEKLMAAVAPEVEKVAISVRVWPYLRKRNAREGMQIYMEAIASLTERLVKHYGIEVTFISSCQGLAHYKYDDAKLARRIVSGLSRSVQEKVVVMDDYHHPQEIMDILKHMDLVVATRMHMMIMALNVGVPVLPIAYEFKTTELLRSMGLRDTACDMETITAGDLRAKADKIIGNYTDYRKRILKAAKAQHVSAMKAAPLLKSAYYQKGQKRYSPAISHHKNNTAMRTRNVVSQAA